MMNKKRPEIGLLRGSAIGLFTKSLGLVSGFILHFFLAKILDQSVYGNYTHILSLCIVLAAVGRFGLDVSIIKIISEAKLGNQLSNIKGVAIASIVLALFFGVVILVTLIVSNALFGGHGFLVTYYIVPLIVGISICLISQGVLRAYGSLFLAFSPDMIGRPLVAVLFSGAAWYLTSELTIKQAVGLHAASAVLCAIAAITFSYRILPLEVRQAKASYRLIDWAKYSGPVFIANLIFVVEIQLVVLLSGFLLSLEETAVVSICMRLTVLCTLAQVAVNMYITPKLATLASAGDTSGLQYLATRASWLFVLPAIPAAYILIVYGDFLLSFFGDAYVSGTAILLPLLLSRTLPALFGPVSSLLQMGGEQRASATISLICLIGFVSTSIMFVPNGGPVALSWLFCIFTFLRQLVSWFWVRRSMGVTSGASIFRLMESTN